MTPVNARSVGCGVCQWLAHTTYAIHINALASQLGGESLRLTALAAQSERDRMPSLAPPDRGWGRGWHPNGTAGEPSLGPYLPRKTPYGRFASDPAVSLYKNRRSQVPIRKSNGPPR